jgi:Spy/CpxP family protein refolding chaperone
MKRTTRRWFHAVILMAVLGTATPARAQDGAYETAAASDAARAPQDPIAAQLFAPEVVMAHQRQIALSDVQRKAITAAIAALQAKAVDLQWQMTSEQAALAELLAKPHVDDAAALTAADHLMALEQRVKHEHLATLITIKNTLRAEQQSRLRALLQSNDSSH